MPRSSSDMFWTALAVVGLGVSAYLLLDWHGHTCAAGHRWRHLGLTSHGSERAHTCPDCGQVEWWRDGEAARLAKRHADHEHHGA